MKRTPPAWNDPMKRQLIAGIRRFFADQRGGEVIEYALVLGLIIVAAIAIIGAVGTKVVAHWNSVNSSLTP
jgi:Flp pilus assembly pilin Flp